MIKNIYQRTPKSGSLPENGFGRTEFTHAMLHHQQKNLVLTFCGQACKDRVGDLGLVWYPLNLLCESLTFEIGSQDYISGNTFLCGDGSQLCLQDDSSYCYYQSAEDHGNQYYEGVYEVYCGQAAMDEVASMTEYGLTMEELERVLSANMNGYIPGGSRPSDYLPGEDWLSTYKWQVALLVLSLWKSAY